MISVRAIPFPGRAVRFRPPSLCSIALALLWAGLLSHSAAAQTLPVTFRYIPEQVVAERAFLPGVFNGWGSPYQANTPSCIGEDHASAMSFVRFERYWLYTIPLEIGSTYEYKVQVHLNIAGTDCSWLTDPLNPRSDPADNDNSVLTVTDPMIFQPAQEIDNGAFSAGLFSTQPFVSIVYHINGVEYTDGLDHGTTRIRAFSGSKTPAAFLPARSSAWRSHRSGGA